MMTISSPSKDDNLGMDNGKYVRYTPEQVEALERLYHDCPKPSSLRRQQLIRECPILSNIEPKQIKVWFQNRRCREKQRKEASRLQAVNRKLTAMNKLLMEENDRLQKQVSHLVYENSYFRQQTQNVTLATTDTSCESVVTSGQHHLTPQHPPKDASPAGLLSIAEETLTEFLSKATGTAVEWVQMPGMKPGPDSIGIIAISHGCSGVASRACGLIGLEPTRVAEILKDWSSWFRDCRAVDTLNVLSTANNGTIELLYMQLYAPTTLAPARDFWLLRYTSPMEDGSLVICERSLNNTQNGPSMPPVPHFVRAEMLPSGYLIRPCEGGGSIIHIVDHVDLEPWSVPEVLRPLYESSTLLAQRTTFAAFSHLRQISQEISQPTVTSWGRRPAALRALGQRMSRGFNEAVNGFADEGWSVTESDGVDDVTVFVNLAPAKATGANQMYAAHGIPVVSNAVLCAKASMLLQDVAPAILMRFLREYRSEWADSSMDAYSAASVKAGPTSLPMARNGSFGSQVILPLAHTLEHEEFMEVVKLENMGHYQDNMMMSPGDIFFLQLCNGVDENAIGTSAELVFAPIDASFTDDAPLLPSGFRIIPINNKLTQNPTRDLASTLEVGVGPPRNQRASNQAGPTKSVMTIAFQFGFEIHLQENISAMARQYVRSIISSVQRVALALSPSPFGSPSLQGNPEAHTLTHWIQQSYSCFLGEELFKSVDERSESVLKTLWNHSDAITCCSLKTLPVFTFANQAERLRCVRMRDPDDAADPSYAVSGGRRIRRRINSRFVDFPSDNSNNNKQSSLQTPSTRLTRNSETAVHLRSENTRKSSPDKEVYTTRGGSASAAGGVAEKPTTSPVDGGVGDQKVKHVWPKLFITLSSKEKEEDFMAMKGCKPPHRPKKRPKIIQRSLLLVSPGGWLTDMCQDRYEVVEKKSTKKRPRGLKAMGSMESDSE